MFIADLSSGFSNFLGSPVGKAVWTLHIVGGLAIVIWGVPHAVVKHHKEGAGKTVRKCVEVFILGIIIAEPISWQILTAGATHAITSVAQYVGSLL